MIASHDEYSFSYSCGSKAKTDLSAENCLQTPDQQDREDAEDEGEDGGEEEAPPLPLLQALLVAVQGKALWRARLHPHHNSITLKQKH